MEARQAIVFIMVTLCNLVNSLETPSLVEMTIAICNVQMDAFLKKWTVSF